MPRVKNSIISRARHKKILKETSGYYGARSRTYRIAHQAVIKSGQYSYRDRRQKKRLFRKLWIHRINAAARQNNITYSQLIKGLNVSSICINRKILSKIATLDQPTFSILIQYAKENLNKNTLKINKVDTSILNITN